MVDTNNGCGSMIICCGRFGNGNPAEPSEHERYCKFHGKEMLCHENTDCDSCIINGGEVSPVSGIKYKGNTLTEWKLELIMQDAQRHIKALHEICMQIKPDESHGKKYIEE